MQKDQSNTPLSPMAATATARRSKEATHEYMIEFTPEELRLSRIHVMARNINPTTFDDREMPTDIHMVSYKIRGEIFTDAVRAFTRVDIFDEYYQKVKDLEGVIVSIKNGYGKIKPRLFGKIDAKNG